MEDPAGFLLSSPTSLAFSAILYNDQLLREFLQRPTIWGILQLSQKDPAVIIDFPCGHSSPVLGMFIQSDKTHVATVETDSDCAGSGLYGRLVSTLSRICLRKLVCLRARSYFSTRVFFWTPAGPGIDWQSLASRPILARMFHQFAIGSNQTHSVRPISLR